MTKHINPFLQVKQFNEAVGNVPCGPKGELSELYLGLFLEEVDEALDGVKALHEATNDTEILAAVDELVDGLLDTIVIAAGWIHVMGLDARPLWAEVHRSNMGKIDPETGTVRRREDGKILKPEGWKPPNLKPILARQLGMVKRAGKDLDAQLAKKAKVESSVAAELAQATVVERMFTVEQAAAIVGVGRSLISNAVKSGRLKHKVFGPRTLRIPESALSEFQQ